MRFLMYPNKASEAAQVLEKRLLVQLHEYGASVCNPVSSQETDIVAVLGGDGTLLRAVRALQGLAKPFWVVNCGHLGYLSDCEKEEAPGALRKILQGDYRLEKRTQLCGMIESIPKLSALNEIIFHRGACTHALRFEISVNGTTAMKYRGDGLIISTASGSTAYNLSAGGPVLMPEMELLALTPICPQTLSAAPLVISARDTVEVKWAMPAYEGIDEKPYLTADGEEKVRLALTGTAKFSAGEQRIALVRTREAEFYSRLLQRMNWNVS